MDTGLMAVWDRLGPVLRGQENVGCALPPPPAAPAPGSSGSIAPGAHVTQGDSGQAGARSQEGLGAQRNSCAGFWPRVWRPQVTQRPDRERTTGSRDS